MNPLLITTQIYQNETKKKGRSIWKHVSLKLNAMKEKITTCVTDF